MPAEKGIAGLIPHSPA